MLRTHDCGELRSEDLGKRVTLAGWVRFRRDHGGVLFFDLADSHGTTQLVLDPEALRQEIDQKRLSGTLNSVGREYVIKVTGVIRERVPGTEDPRNPTGMVEVLIEEAELLNTSRPIPFEVAEQKNSLLPNEDLRIRYRYLDLRRPQMISNLRFRAALFAAARQALNEMGFMEVETPMLTRSTAEGARDFLVPSRIQPGHFYALPQSPQLFKQMLMVGGVERYFQFARCFRDEDSRADRQPEFTQMDVEMSFVEQEDVHWTIEAVLRSVWRNIYGEELPTPFPRLSFHDSMARFGTDAPDLRFGLELVEVTDVVRKAHYEIFQKILAKKAAAVVCLNLKASLVKEKDAEVQGVGRKEVDRLIEWAKAQGMGGLTWMRCTPNGLESNIVKYFPEEVRRELQAKMGTEVGDLLLFLAGPRTQTLKAGGALRMKLARDNGLLEGKGHQFVWIVDCPLFQADPVTGKLSAFHHPFVRPVQGDLPEGGDMTKVMGMSYDLVLDGSEIGSGSIRNHDAKV
ncbi:MAG: aspartate--tRNA ligase, partial [Methanomassiliicoccales archaeon]|nr:aspartate--tRNA ligase [Methanomassiliicoccales archaeon]